MSTTARELQAVRTTTSLSALVETTKPRLSLLVLFTVFIGFALASGPVSDYSALLWTMVGTALVAGGANAFNQVMESELDAQMRRTCDRPLPTGRTGAIETTLFAALISLGGLLILIYGVNLITAALGAMTLAMYVFVYTPLKRITSLNTLAGAVVGAVPPLMGWTAARGVPELGGWALFAILFVWQLPHFLSIAWLHREDYARGGFRMMSVTDATGRLTRRQVLVMSMLLVPVSVVPTFVRATGWAYLLGAVVLGLGFVVCCRWSPGERQSADARRSFIASIVYLPCLLIIMVLDKV